MGTYTSSVRGALIAIIATASAGAQAPADSTLAGARSAGARAARERGVARWFGAGLVVPPVVIATGAVGLAQQHKSPVAAPLAVAVDLGLIVAMQRRMRHGTEPSEADVMRALGTPSGAARAAFIESYRSTLRDRRQRLYHIGALASGTALTVLAVMVLFGFGYSEAT